MTADPIAQLVSDLEAEGRPSLAWVIEWERDGREPVLAAWRASRDPWAMAMLLVRHTSWQRAFRNYAIRLGDQFAYRSWIPSGLVCELETHDGRRIHATLRNPDAVEEIRREVPVPTSLTELLAAGRTRGAAPAGGC